MTYTFNLVGLFFLKFHNPRIHLENSFPSFCIEGNIFSHCMFLFDDQNVHHHYQQPFAYFDGHSFSLSIPIHPLLCCWRQRRRGEVKSSFVFVFPSSISLDTLIVSSTSSACFRLGMISMLSINIRVLFLPVLGYIN